MKHFQIENIRSDKYEGICFYICHTNHQTGGECLRCASLLRVANGAAAVRISGRSPVVSSPIRITTTNEGEKT